MAAVAHGIGSRITGALSAVYQSVVGGNARERVSAVAIRAVGRPPSPQPALRIPEGRERSGLSIMQTVEMCQTLRSGLSLHVRCVPIQQQIEFVQAVAQAPIFQQRRYDRMIQRYVLENLSYLLHFDEDIEASREFSPDVLMTKAMVKAFVEKRCVGFYSVEEQLMFLKEISLAPVLQAPELQNILKDAVWDLLLHLKVSPKIERERSPRSQENLREWEESKKQAAFVMVLGALGEQEAFEIYPEAVGKPCGSEMYSKQG